MTPPVTPEDATAIRLDRFMGHANALYYAHRDPFADFITAPEISQIFGEVLGGWAAICWMQLGSPSRVILVEAGPGRGTLMADALRLIAARAPDFLAALELHLVETSPRLRVVQAQALSAFPVQPVWHDTLDTLPAGPMVLLANEFLDALPIRQFQRMKTGWVERYVDGAQFTLRPAEDLPPSLNGREADEGEMVEICPDALAVSEALARRFRSAPGVALFIDYGYGASLAGDSLQALRDGKPVSPLVEPGTADLTAHVDFHAFIEAALAGGAACFGAVTQGALLAALGAVQRAEKLCQIAPDHAAETRAALDRLIAPDRMGGLFKAAALASPGFPPPPGFVACPPLTPAN